MKKGFFYCTIQIFLLSMVVFSCSKEDLNADSIENPQFAASNAKIDAFLLENQFSGAVLLAKNDEVVFAKGYVPNEAAWPNQQNQKNHQNQKITINTVFETGSLTKQMTAAAIMQLAEKNQLKLSDPLSEYFPDAPNASSITIEMLLKMRSGLTDMINSSDEFFPPSVYRQIEKATYQNKPLPQNLVQNHLAASPVLAKPDSTYFYCNTNYYLLAKIIEKVSGQNYYDYMMTHIFEPAQMATANLEFQKTDVKGYDWKGRYYSIPAELSFGCGDVNASVVDLYKWNKALRRGKIVTKKTYKKMMNTTSYGYGVNNQNGEIFHSGVTGVFNSFMAYYPKSKILVIVLINEPVQKKNAAIISRNLYKIFQEDVNVG